ncbi:DUF1801 domain-containing protein [Shimia thalassica]|uniref:DUF1801 domain-containing protein n=1 Tax=Shimia thalassica TaxID=1715693 RepID=UPI0026E1F68B|nr:DUF1801 domain-containing protein [Shimia thalassica]MDO6484130.1 DUF1801 domain-containing protein [Shimia thalassica]
MPTPFADPDVKAVYDRFPDPERGGLMALREMIFETAIETPEAGTIEETLKWGQPSYLTPVTKSGSTVRLGVPKTGGLAMYTHCQTTLISDFKTLFPEDFTFDGNRGVIFESGQTTFDDRLRLLIKSALTYHLK